MTKHEEIKPAKPTGLDLMRAPFAPHQISKLPKPTRQQTDEVKADFKNGIRCTVCGLWHHPKVVHLDYVGHAALTDRLLDCDPAWNWEPLVFGPDGAPALDENCGMWIRLTVCGQTRLGYGHAEGKRGGDAIKEVIGDALRNAAMRFGAALELWHKGELHVDDAKPELDRESPADIACASLTGADTLDALKAIWTDLPPNVRAIPAVEKAKDARKVELDKAKIITDDEIPY